MARKPNDVRGVFEKNPGSGIWYVRYRTAGKYVKKRIGTRGRAIDYLKTVHFIKATGEGIIATSAKELTLTGDEARAKGKQGSGITVGTLCEDYLAHIRDDNNPRKPSDQVNPPQRLRAIKAAFGDRPAETVAPHEVEDWLISLGKKPATLNRYRSTFSSVYRYAKERAKVSSNPVRDTQQFKVALPDPRFLLPEEETALRAVLQGWIDDCPAHHRLQKLYLRCHPIELTLALGTGLRKGNLYALRWKDHVDMTRREFRLPPSMMKNRKPLTLPIINDVYEALEELRTLQAEIEMLQAVNRPDGHESERMVADGRIFHIAENREWWSAALEEAGIENFRWHDLRHTFATRLVEAGVNLRVVQEACGHGSIAITARYAHVQTKALHDSMSLLNRKAS